MKYKHKFEIIRRFFLLFLCCCLLAPAFESITVAGDTVSHAVEVLFQPYSGSEESVLAGNVGFMHLYADATSAETGTAVIKIKLPAGVETYMTQFAADNTYTVSGVTVYLLHDNEQKPYLQFTLIPGQTINTAIQFQFPKGRTPSGTAIDVVVDEDDEVEDDDIVVDTTFSGDIVRTGGTLTVTSDFKWEGVVKKEIPENSPVLSVEKLDESDESYHLTRDLTYEIYAQSQNNELGSIYTKVATLTDNLTLPDTVSFEKSGTLSVEKTASASEWLLKSGSGTDSVVVARITSRGLGSDITADISSASIDSEKKILTFTYTQTASLPDDLNSFSEMTNPNLTVVIPKEQVCVKNLDAMLEEIEKANQEPLEENRVFGITNTVNFSAIPWVAAKNAESSASVVTQIASPEKSIGIGKTSNITTENGRMVLVYTIRVTNTCELPLTDVTIRDYLPEEVELIEEENPEYVVKTDSDGSIYLEWTNQEIDKKGESIYKEIKVKVKKDVAPGTEIVNTAKARVEENPWVEESVTNRASDADRKVTIKKTNNKGNSGTVYEGDTITYTIKIGNEGIEPAVIAPLDYLPAQVVNPRDYQYSLDGETWNSFASGQVSYADNVITFPDYVLDNNPETDDYRSEIYLRFTADIQGVSELGENKQIINTAKAQYEDGTKTASSIVLTRERVPKILLNKEAGEPEDLGGNCYRIPYILTVRNEGDAVTSSDVITVSDVMNGDLMPLEQADKMAVGDIVTINGTWECNSARMSITGECTRISESGYMIMWKLDGASCGLESGTTQEPSMGTIAYSGYIKMPSGSEAGITSVNALNSARLYYNGIYGGTSGSYTHLKPDPGMGKIIEKVNGETAKNSTSCELYPNDEVTYLLTATNTGNAAIYARIADDLPLPYEGDFEWILNENVFIMDSQFGVTPTLVKGGNQLLWENVRIPANATKTVRVVLKFPGAKQFNQAFVNPAGVRTLYNTMTMVTPDPEDFTQDKTWIAKVSHTTKPVKLNLKKMASTRTAVPGGSDVEFTLSDFGTNVAVSNMQLIDNFADVATYMDLSKIQSGSYSGVSSYKIIIKYADDTTKTQTITNPAQETSITSNLSGAVSVTWYFGDVDSLTINSNPCLTMTAKLDVRGNAINKATLYYNEETTSASAPVSVTYKDLLKKTATKNGELVDNETNPLKPGDSVTFTIQYKNMTDEPITINSSNPLKDHLTTKGLKAGTSTVTGRVVDSKNNKVDNTISPGNITITASDIASTKAKLISFTLSKPLQPGELVIISYTVQVGEGFEKSQTDVNQGKDSDNVWSQNSNGSLNESPENLALLHNRVIAVQNGTTSQAGTGYYYMKGEDELYFQKSVAGFSTIERGSRYDPASLRIANDRSDTGDLSYWGVSKYGTNGSGAGMIDFVRYTVVIANNLNSGDPVTISQIFDNLPVNNIMPSGGASSTQIKQLVYFTCLYWDATSRNVLKGNQTGNAGSVVYWNTTNANSATITATDVETVTSIPSGYTAVGATASPAVTNVNNNTATFKFKGTDGNNLVLNPGEIFAFSYIVVIDRRSSVTDPVSWDNTATLTTGQDFAAVKIGGIETQLYKSTAGTKTDRTKLKRNMADGVRTKANTYTATVSVYPPSNKIGIQKTVAGRIPGTLGSPPSYATVSAATPVSIDGLGFGDIVCWDIKITNSGTTNITGGTFEDYIPYPYVVIRNGNTVAKNQPSGSVGTVVTNSSAGFGTSGQTVKITKFSLNAGASVTLRIYTYYNPPSSGQLFTLNYTNTAQFQPGGKVTVTQGNPVYSSGTVVGARANASVSPITQNGTTAVKSVVEYSNKDNVAFGNDSSNNSIVVKTGTTYEARVQYTCSVTNDSEKAYQNFVLIDKLPYVNDTGVINSKSTRGSKYRMLFYSNEDKNIVVKLDGVTLTAGTDYVVEYTTLTSAYTTDIWDGGTLPSQPSLPNSAYAFRLKLIRSGGFPANSTLTVTFDAHTPSSLTTGRIGWNSFGYAYTVDSTRIYAEPAKVGVEVPCVFKFTKVAAEDTTQTLIGAEFALYRLVCTDASHDHSGLISTSAPGSCWQLVDTKTSDPTVTFTNLVAGEYRLVETRAPDGRIRPSGQWKLIIDAETNPQITAAGNSNPPAFLSGSGGLSLPNQKIVVIPSSGGWGKLLYVALGMVLMSSAALLFIKWRRNCHRLYK